MGTVEVAMAWILDNIQAMYEHIPGYNQQRLLHLDLVQLGTNRKLFHSTTQNAVSAQALYFCLYPLL